MGVIFGPPLNTGAMDPSKVKKEPGTSGTPTSTPRQSATGGAAPRLSSIRRGGKPAFAPKLGAVSTGTPPPQAKVKKEPGTQRKPREQRGRGGRGRGGRGGPRDRASAPRAPRPLKKPEAAPADEEAPVLVKHNDRFDESKESGTYPVSVPFLAPGNVDMNDDNLGSFLASADADTMMFMQLPSVLPVVKEDNLESIPVRDMPSGYIGKLLVYRSGKVKMKLGNILFDVSIGTPSTSLQHVAYISPEEQKALVLGTIKQRTIVTPNIEDLLTPEVANEEETWDEMDADEFE